MVCCSQSYIWPIFLSYMWAISLNTSWSTFWVANKLFCVCSVHSLSIALRYLDSLFQALDTSKHVGCALLVGHPHRKHKKYSNLLQNHALNLHSTWNNSSIYCRKVSRKTFGTLGLCLDHRFMEGFTKEGNSCGYQINNLASFISLAFWCFIYGLLISINPSTYIWSKVPNTALIYHSIFLNSTGGVL